MAPVMNSHCSCCHPSMIECEWGSSRLLLRSWSQIKPLEATCQTRQESNHPGKDPGAQISVLSLLSGPQPHAALGKGLSRERMRITKAEDVRGPEGTT